MFEFNFAWFMGALIGGSVMGIATKAINENKGYEGGFAWGFFLGIIGILVVALKPDNRPQYIPPQHVGEWKCACGQSNSNTLEFCVRCRRSRQEVMAKKRERPMGHSERDAAMEQLERLGALREKGIVTEEEFLEKKKEILSRI